MNTTRTYRIAVFTGNLNRPVNRVTCQSATELLELLWGYPSKQECSVIIDYITETPEGPECVLQAIFFGTKEHLLARENIVEFSPCEPPNGFSEEDCGRLDDIVFEDTGTTMASFAVSSKQFAKVLRGI